MTQTEREERAGADDLPQEAAPQPETAEAAEDAEDAEERELRKLIEKKWETLFQNVDELAKENGTPAINLYPVRTDFDLYEQLGIKGNIHVVVDCIRVTPEGRPQTIIVDAINKNQLLERNIGEADWTDGTPKVVDPAGYPVNTDTGKYIGTLAILHIADKVVTFGRQISKINVTEESFDIDVPDNLRQKRTVQLGTPPGGNPSRPN